MKIIATMATYKPRLIKIVWDAAESLLPQVDKLYINVNPTPALDGLDTHLMQSAELELEKKYPGKLVVNYMKKDLGDLAKFYPFKELGKSKIMLGADNLYLTCDDDLIYPADYVAVAIMQYQVLHSDVVSFGGKQLKGMFHTPKGKSYREMVAERISCFEGTDNAMHIDLPLSGVSVFKGGKLTQALAQVGMEYKNKADVALGQAVADIGGKCSTAKFTPQWIKYNGRMAGRPTIWDTMNQNKAFEAELVALVDKLRTKTALA
jgi:hypothetical protein